MTPMQWFIDRHGDEFSAMWTDEDTTVTDIQLRFRLPIIHLRSAAKALSLGRKASADKVAPPTEAEIAQRAAEIRARWTPAERWQRLVNKTSSWSLPCLAESGDRKTYRAGMAPGFMKYTRGSASVVSTGAAREDDRQ